MTTTLRHRAPDRARLVQVAVIVVAALLVVVGAWQLGASLRPDAADASAERQRAYDAARADARSDAATAAYDAAWQPAFERGAQAGRTEGDAAGIAAARAQIAAAAPQPAG